MLYWFKILLLFFFFSFISFFYANYSLIDLILHSELLIILLFLLFLSISIIYHINFLIGLSICFLIFGGMELALNLLLLVF